MGSLNQNRLKAAASSCALPTFLRCRQRLLDGYVFVAVTVALVTYMAYVVQRNGAAKQASKAG